MLWRVRLTFAITVDAPTKQQAHAKAAEMLKTSPEAFISLVEDARFAGKKQSMLSKLLLGPR